MAREISPQSALVGAWLRRKRQAQGWTQPRLAELLNEAGDIHPPLSKLSISRMEAGQQEVGLAVVYAAAAVFSTTPGDLLAEVKPSAARASATASRYAARLKRLLAAFSEAADGLVKAGGDWAADATQFDREGQRIMSALVERELPQDLSNTTASAARELFDHGVNTSPVREFRLVTGGK